MDKGKKYLADILLAISLVEDFLAETTTFEDYINDKKTQSAVERQLGIIGEAVNKHRQLEIEPKLPNTNEIVGFRNRLIHNYDGIDMTIVWAIVKKHLPILKEAAQGGLK
ncbi:MAG: DUF86 domain-containing protein [Phaeodactylibacter xiamenensis]|uniref:DUF86 domain-containing protein n=1 Tax=Phaeodactylibacter xiamenensis TaxID=1524460 RepID=A0A098S0U4_9BACT|nr:HepT-like ribonuclease domain-containing protein [Phaeodactylibacter xiamenensis]KGE85413.1 hypothetical protein IX84_28420 [Phaeodactylibacter xiamenensis]MCR9050269.1 DUF86 domain-containing protein [bacterium]